MQAFLPTNLSLPMSAVFGLIAASIYVVSCFRRGRRTVTALDVLLVISIMAAVTGISAPLLAEADRSARGATLKTNLQIIRQEIEQYKLEHDGRPPLLYKGGFPQLSSVTDAAGVPGKPGGGFRYGPYLHGGMPLNPFTGSSLVEATEDFPPSPPTGKGGWYYDQATGRIIAQLPEGTETSSRE